MSAITRLRALSVQEYLDTEQKAEVRHEFVAGVVYAMVGASALHNLLAGSLSALLRMHLRGSPCSVFQSDMKVRIDDVFYYPDVMVVCVEIDPTSLYQTDPVLIVEILSESIEAKDRLEKRVAYQKLSSLKEYVLVAQDKMRIEIIRRAEDGWQLETYGDGDVVRFGSIGLEKRIEDIYEDVVKYVAQPPTRGK